MANPEVTTDKKPNKGLTYCGKEYKYQKAVRTAKICRKCGYRIRGKNHEEGTHHNA